MGRPPTAATIKPKVKFQGRCSDVMRLVVEPAPSAGSGCDICGRILRTMGRWLEFVEKKIGTAVKLDAGECDGSYSDACTLLAALLSGIAAQLWPGDDRIDRKRFVELWVRYSDPVLQPCLISVPLLRRFVRKAGRDADARALEAARDKVFTVGSGSLVLIGADVDMAAEAVDALSTTITTRENRRFSYPALFYTEVRNSLTHEYRLSADAVSHFATRKDANVSYVNRIDEDAPELTRRLIHFHMNWLTQITRSIATNTASLIEIDSEINRPTKWWIEG